MLPTACCCLARTPVALLFKAPPSPGLPAVGLPLPQRSAEVDAVVREFHEALARSSDMAVAVAAIQALTTVIKKSGSTTMMGLERELKDAAASLQNCNPTAISLKAGCELFLRYTTRTSALEADTFAAAKKRLIERGQHFAGAPPAPSLLTSSGKDPGNAPRECYGCPCR